MNTPSVKRQRRDHPIEIHCDATKSVPDPFPSITMSQCIPMGSNLTLPLPLGVLKAIKYIKVHFSVHIL